MAGPEVGDIYLQTHADTKGLAAEIRRAAKQAGKTFGTEFSKGADQGLSGIGNQIRSNLGGDHLGRMTAKDFAKSFEDDLKQRNWDFDVDLGKAVRTGDFGPMLKDVEDVNAQLERMRDRITSLGKGGAFKQLGTDTETVQQQLNAYVDELNDAARVQTQAAAAADELAASEKKQAAILRDNQAAMKAWTEDQLAGIQASERLAKANQKAVSKEQAAQLRENQAAMRAANQEILEGIKYSEQLARSGNLTKSTKSQNAYRDAVADTAASLRQMQTELNKMGSGKQFKGQEDAIKRLAVQVREASEQFTILERSGRDAVVGLDRGTSDFGMAMERNTARVKAFNDSLRDIRAQIDVQADYPSAAEAKARGALLGSTFGKAFNDATEKRAASGGGKGFFSALASEWQQFLYAFPAEVTILARYIALIGTEVATLGSAIASSLTATVASLGTAVGGLGAVAGATFPAMVYSIVLATQSMEEFEKSFPATQSAIEGLKSTFQSVDVAGFAAQWSSSVREFASTLSGVLEGAQLGSAFGAAAAQVTAAFTSILTSPALQGFIAAMQTTIPNALVGIGQGAAGLTSALLPVLTAAAPLAQALASQFSAWATNLAATANSADGLERIHQFMAAASGAIDSLISIVGDLSAALGNVFRIGSTTGNQFLSTLADLAGQFRTFTESARGENALAQWFATGAQVMSALGPLLGAIGTMFAGLVTPATVAQLVGLINGLTQLTPVLGQIMAALGQLNFLGLIVDVLNAIGTAISPILPMVGQLAGLISSTLGSALTAIQPALNALGQALGDTLAQVLPVLSQMFSDLQPAFVAIGDAVSALAPAFVSLFVAFNPVLRIVLLLLPALQPLIPVLVNVVEWISQLAVQFADVINPIVETVAAFLGFSKATAPLSGGIDKIAGGFGNLAKSAGGFVEGIGKAMPKIATTIAKVVQGIAQSLADVLPKVATAVQGIIPALATTLSTIIPTIVEAITAAVPVLLQAAIDLFTTLVTAVTTVLPMVLQAILTALPQLIQAIVGMIPILLQAAIQLFTALVQAVVTVVPMLLQTVLTLLPQLITTILGMIPMLLQTAMTLFLSIVQAFWQASPQILTALLGMLPQLITTIVGMIPQLLTAGIQLFVSLVTAIANALPQILTALFGILPDLLTTIVNMIPRLISTGIELFVSLVTAIAKALPDILSALFGILPDLLNTLISMIPQMITTAVKLFISIITALAQALPQILSALFGILPDLMDTLIDMIPQLITAAVDLFLAIVDGISGAWPEIWNALQGLGSDILGALGDIDLAQIGRDIIQSLWNGLQDRWNDVTGWIGGIGDWIADHKGPPSYDRVLLTPAGRQIMDGLQAGLIQGMPGLRRTLSAVTGQIEGTRFRTQVDVGGGAMARDVLSAIAANEAGPRVLIADGAIRVTPVTADPELTAQAVVDRMVLAMQ